MSGPSFRIGLGRDLHRLVPGRRFLLAGVEIPSDSGELGHSDGDVLAHAVTDAVLGAAGLADIGQLFFLKKLDPEAQSLLQPYVLVHYG